MVDMYSLFVNLAQKGYLEKIHLKGNKFSWIYKKEFSLTKEEIHNGIEDENFTLTHQLVEKIKNYIEKTYKQGDKILPNSSLIRLNCNSKSWRSYIIDCIILSITNPIQLRMTSTLMS